MSKYTTEVRYICEVNAGLDESAGYNDVEQIIEASAPNIFDFNFPIFDEAYRLPLEIKILRHYYTREISEETVGLWKLRLQAKLNEIMPYYNKLYHSETLEFNPLYDVDYTREYTKNTEGERNGENTSSETGTIGDSGNNSSTQTRNMTDATTIGRDTWDLYSDTPQGGINGLLDDGQVETDGDLDNNTYLTNARHVMESGNAGTTNRTGTVGTTGTNSNTRTLNTRLAGTNTMEITNTDEYVERVAGKTGGYTFSKALMEYRKTLLNIDMEIIRELKDLFFKLW